MKNYKWGRWYPAKNFLKWISWMSSWKQRNFTPTWLPRPPFWNSERNELQSLKPKCRAVAVKWNIESRSRVGGVEVKALPNCIPEQILRDSWRNIELLYYLNMQYKWHEESLYTNVISVLNLLSERIEKVMKWQGRGGTAEGMGKMADWDSGCRVNGSNGKQQRSFFWS